jgi:Protein of unknown function (DUF4007)
MSATLPTSLEGMLSSFARHETFHPRYGWLRKAYAAAADGAVFHHEDATTILGVGKNMVRAIRYWGLAYKILEEEPSRSNPRLSDVKRTAFGEQMFREGGDDPYLEEPGSLWLLHWQLLRRVPTCRAPSWWAIFNSPRTFVLTDDALIAELRRFCDEHPDLFGEVAKSSLEKDARCLLRMYGSVTQGRDLAEDSVDSPFAELDLIRPLPGSRREFTINRGPKRNLPDAVVAWACLDYLQLQGGRSRVVSLNGLTQSPGSPGRAFALTETALADALSRFTERHVGLISLTDAAGVRQLVSPEPDLIDNVKERILRALYRGRRA